jgi:cephalosporin-C deacetylase-like acetyl esterase
MSNRSLDNFVFHEGTSVVNEGKIYMNNNAEACKLEFSVSEGTTFTAEIRQKSRSESEWGLLPFVKDSTCTIITNGEITDSDSYYSIDLTGVAYLKVDIVALDGELSAYGRMVG